LGASEAFATPRHNHHFVFRVSAYVGEDLRQLPMRCSAPLESISVGVKGNLKDPVSTLHADVFIFVDVLV
jgi:hypothetical protein